MAKLGDVKCCKKDLNLELFYYQRHLMFTLMMLIKETQWLHKHTFSLKHILRTAEVRLYLVLILPNISSQFYLPCLLCLKLKGNNLGPL